MDRKIALKWASALESGEYKQAHGVLRTTDLDGSHFCCLGVLCNLHAQEHPEIAAEQDSPYEYMHSEVELPETVKDWAGMGSTGGDFKGFAFPIPAHESYATSLIELNDEWEYDFKKIAAIIRKHSAKL